jgi:hypothetical protein
MTIFNSTRPSRGTSGGERVTNQAEDHDDLYVRPINSFLTWSHPTSEYIVPAIAWSYGRSGARQLPARKPPVDFEAQLSKLERENATRSVPEMLHALSAGFGATWVDSARLLQVSVPALRKWRKAGGATARNTEQLASLVAFLSVLKELHVADPAMWLNVPFVAGYTACPRHFYTRASAPALLSIAFQSAPAEEFLDEVSPAWREDFRSKFRTALQADGSLAIVDRED